MVKPPKLNVVYLDTDVLYYLGIEIKVAFAVAITSTKFSITRFLSGVNQKKAEGLSTGS